MSNFKKEWMKKADIDFFSQFMALWLAFNSWYRSHYSELQKNDRAFIEKLKADFSDRNHPYKKYCNLIAEEQIKENLAFKSDLESLHFSLNRANIKYPDGYYNYAICLENALQNYSQRKDSGAYVCLTKRLRQPDKIKIGTISVVSDCKIFFPCLLEVIYQVRCYLFHGDLSPNQENHEVVKYCYFILSSLMKE